MVVQLDREIGFILSRHHLSPEKAELVDRFISLTRSSLPDIAYQKAHP